MHRSSFRLNTSAEGKIYTLQCNVILVPVFMLRAWILFLVINFELQH
jgi:hypothetical protein